MKYETIISETGIPLPPPKGFETLLNTFLYFCQEPSRMLSEFYTSMKEIRGQILAADQKIRRRKATVSRMQNNPMTAREDLEETRQEIRVLEHGRNRLETRLNALKDREESWRTYSACVCAFLEDPESTPSYGKIRQLEWIRSAVSLLKTSPRIQPDQILEMRRFLEETALAGFLDSLFSILNGNPCEVRPGAAQSGLIRIIQEDVLPAYEQENPLQLWKARLKLRMLLLNLGKADSFAEMDFLYRSFRQNLEQNREEMRNLMERMVRIMSAPGHTDSWKPRPLFQPPSPMTFYLKRLPEPESISSQNKTRRFYSRLYQAYFADPDYLGLFQFHVARLKTAEDPLDRFGACIARLLDCEACSPLRIRQMAARFYLQMISWLSQSEEEKVQHWICTLILEDSSQREDLEGYFPPEYPLKDRLLAYAVYEKLKNQTALQAQLTSAFPKLRNLKKFSREAFAWLASEPVTGMPDLPALCAQFLLLYQTQPETILFSPILLIYLSTGLKEKIW